MSDIKLSVLLSNQASVDVNTFSLKLIETAMNAGLDAEIRVIEEGETSSPEEIMKELTGEYILWISSRILIGEDTLRTLCFFLDEHREAGLTGIRLIDGHGVYRPESQRVFPSAWSKMINKLGSGVPEAKAVSNSTGEKEGKIALPSDAVFLFRRANLQQLQDVVSDYPKSGWDVQLADRMLKKGFVNYFIPERVLCIREKDVNYKSRHRRLLVIGREDNIEKAKKVASSKMPELEYINGWNIGENRVMDAICRKNQMKGFTDIAFIYPEIRMEQMFLFMEKMPEKKTAYHLYDSTTDTWIITIP